jgi:hypothetical protein
MGWKYERKKEFLDWRDTQVATLKVLFTVLKSRKVPAQVLIGPANSAGQASAWITAIKKYSGIPGKSMRILSGGTELFEADYKLDRKAWITWNIRVERGLDAIKNFSHIYLESLNPIFGLKSHNGFTAIDGVNDLILFKRAGKKVGAIFHGSDIRDVDRQIATNPYSPFKNGGDDLVKLRKRSSENRSAIPLLIKKNIPVFVTTPDLLADAPGSIWLPVVIDLDKYLNIAKQKPAFDSGGPVKVLYLPSNSWIKSASIIEPVLDKLHNEGVIERIYSDFVSNEQVAALIGRADVVIDQFLGIIGVFALEAMAAGRMVLTYLHESFYQSAPKPQITQITPESLEMVLRNLKPNEDQINSGIDFVKTWHSGKTSSEILLNA